MTGRIARRLSPILLLLALSGCGSNGTAPGTEPGPPPPPPFPPSTEPPPPASETTALRLYFLREGQVAAAGRTVPRTKAVAAAAVRELARGPVDEEVALGLSTEVPVSFTPELTLRDGVLQVTGAEDLAREGVAQLVYTLTQFPTVRAVELAGERYTRADFENLTPAILVESPTPGERVSSPLHASGTANTFEATFAYELTDPDGRIVAQDFATATSGSGQRGTFELTVPFTVDRTGLGELIVFERSAADGSRIHVVEIPVRLQR
jgi:hypothetical protein